MIAGITLWELLTKIKTITFIMNSSDELLWLPNDYLLMVVGCRQVYDDLPKISGNPL
jgi:hypothetical protein